MALVVGNDLRAVNAAPFDGAERYRGFGLAAVSSIVRFMRVFLI